MSGSNAISGVVLIGAILLIRVTESTNYFALIMATLGIILGTINLVGGFAVTGRMLEMFNKKKKKYEVRVSVLDRLHNESKISKSVIVKL